MGMAAILVIWPKPFEQNSIPFPHPKEAQHDIWFQSA